MLRHMRMQHSDDDRERRSSRRSTVQHDAWNDVAGVPQSHDSNDFTMLTGSKHANDMNIDHFEAANTMQSLSQQQPIVTGFEAPPISTSFQSPMLDLQQPLDPMLVNPMSYTDIWWDPSAFLLEDNFVLEDFMGVDPLAVPDTDDEQLPIYDEPSSTSLSKTKKHGRPLPRRVPDLRRHWPTQVVSMHGSLDFASRGASPARDDVSPENIDQRYRADAASRLAFASRTEPLPPLCLLNSFIHLFFTRFNAVLPLVHAPTFRPTKPGALLVLSICSAGSLFFGSKEAKSAGAMLFERVNKAHLGASWEKELFKTQAHSFLLLKAALIGQTFAMLSGNPVHLDTMVAFHGTVISIARRLRLFDAMPQPILDEDIDGADLQAAWKRWAKEEECRRFVACLHIHDAEATALFKHDPFLRHDKARLPRICPDDVFNAPTAEVWQERMQRFQATADLNSRSTPRSSAQRRSSESALAHAPTLLTTLEAYTILAGIGATISDMRGSDMLDADQTARFEQELLKWYDRAATSSDMWNAQNKHAADMCLNLLALWHGTWLTLFSDFNALEAAIGRDGADVPSKSADEASEWASRDTISRCLLHAWLLDDCIDRLSTMSVILPSTPRVLFSAAIVWEAYSIYGNGLDTRVSTQKIHSEVQRLLQWANASPRWPSAVQILVNDRNTAERVTRLQETLDSVPTVLRQRTLFALTDTLRRSSTYGVAGRMANVIEAMLSHDAGANEGD